MTQKIFKGVVVPMVSPFQADGGIDTAAVEKLMDRFAQHQLSPLVLGTTGESASLGEDESIVLLKAAIATKSPNQKVYAGIVNNEVARQVSLGKQYLDLGADAVVATLPSYYCLTPIQMEKHFELLAASIGGPMLIYNIKATTQMSIPISVVESLSQHPDIYGIKDSERDMERLSEMIRLFKDREDFSYFCGWGAATVKALQLGADGIVPSTGNLVPEHYGEIVKAAKKGDWELSNLYQSKTDAVANIYQSGMTLGQSLAALKLILNNQEICHPFMKPPLTPLDAELVTTVMANWEHFCTELAK
ncbi:dihydrodipicolinate synthase family protein [Pleomorphovibrio marinus]|uniref:dihydrodipicolinate synthase family protein n=1 Tax=Pleomorphovibrio marinus TaxID=2164132 RepID=UPI000E0C24D7|nr:dihydrodipicolinate synthase family protein [Pleomorphovibrio marinus]